MAWNWDDFSADSDTQEVSLLVSVRTQSLLLSALTSIQRRWNWLDVEDSVWDDIDGSISAATNEVMETVMPDFTPVGAIVAYPSLDIPNKWEVCAGAFLPEDSYPELFALIGTKYGSSGVNFRLPDLREKFVLGHRNDVVSGDAVLDEVGGSATHTLTIAEMPAHTHDILRRGNATGSTIALATITNSEVPNPAFHTSPDTAMSRGGGGAHNNMPPFHSLIYIIKVLP